MIGKSICYVYNIVNMHINIFFLAIVKEMINAQLEKEAKDKQFINKALQITINI